MNTMEKEIDTNLGKQLDIWDKEYYAWFTIRTKKDGHSENVHDAFKSFAKAECQDNYTVALEKLLMKVDSDYKYEMLYELISILRAEVEELKTKKEEKKDEGMF